MQFRSPNDNPIRLALTSGHSAIVSREWRELPEILHHAALSAGCECDQEHIVPKRVEVESGPDAMNRVVDHDGEYRKALAVMIERNEEGDFTGADLPNINVVSKLCGFSARKEDVLRVFRAMSAEAASE